MKNFNLVDSRTSGIWSVGAIGRGGGGGGWGVWGMVWVVCLGAEARVGGRSSDTVA